MVGIDIVQEISPRERAGIYRNSCCLRREYFLQRSNRKSEFELSNINSWPYRSSKKVIVIIDQAWRDRSPLKIDDFNTRAEIDVITHVSYRISVNQ